MTFDDKKIVFTFLYVIRADTSVIYRYIYIYLIDFSTSMYLCINEYCVNFCSREIRVFIYPFAY
jgi:surfactin synthase thioesterase subunit